MRLVWEIFGAFVLGSMLAAMPVDAAPFRLVDALAITYDTNPKLDQARAGLEALDEEVAQANSGWRPTINVTGSYGTEHGTIDGVPNAFDSHPLTSEVSLTQPIFRGGRTYAEVGQAIARVRAGRSELTGTEQSVLLDAVTAYMDVVRDTASLQINNQNVNSLESQLKDVQLELSAGAVTKTDALQAKARLSRAQSDAVAAEDQLATSRAAFESVIGRPAETLENSPSLPPVPVAKDAALNTALKQNPDLLQARSDERAADYAVDDAVGALLPQVSVSGQYQYLRDAAGTNIFATKSPQKVLSVIGQVTIPIYQGGAEDAAVRRAKDVRREAQLAIVIAERSVRREVDNAWQALHSANRSIVVNEAQKQADESAVDGVVQEQQAGERSVLDVLNAQQEFFSAEIAVVNSRHDSVVATYRLLAAMGQLTARSLGLNVRQYDPRIHFDSSEGAWFGFGD